MKTMRQRLAALLSVAGVLIFASCHKAPDSNEKILHVAVDDEIKGLDPVDQTDEYARLPITQIYEPLYQYKYLERPYALDPLLAEGMPEVSKDRLTYTIHLRPNVRFHDDPVFGGKGRRVQASDVIYSFKRLADPHTKSANYWILNGRIAGLDDFRERLKRLPAQVNYDRFDVPGLAAPDERTVVIRLTRPYRQLPYILAMLPTSVVPHEAVEKYGREFPNHPVGTGPFVLKEWVRGQKIVFERNRAYWGPPPFVDGVVLSVFVETQPRWLNFLKGNLDYATVPKEALDDVSKFSSKGISVSRTPSPDIVYFFFNMNDPVVGRNKYLRQAISCAVDRQDLQKLFYKNRSLLAQGPIPPDLFGYDPNLKDPNGYDLERAKKLMVEARKEYRRQGGKGEIPPIVYDALNNVFDRQMTEVFSNSLAKIGLTVKTRIDTWPQFSERKQKNQLQFGYQSWFADYPNPENFLQLGYSRNGSPGPNDANFKNARYDELYEKMRDLEDGPERAAMIREMVGILHEEVPWIFVIHRVRVIAQQGWLKNFKYHDMERASYKRLDIDLAEKKRLLSTLR